MTKPASNHGSRQRRYKGEAYSHAFPKPEPEIEQPQRLTWHCPYCPKSFVDSYYGHEHLSEWHGYDFDD